MLWAGLFFERSAGAQAIPFLDMAVSPAVQTAAPGDSSLWTVQLINNNSDTAYFVLMGFNDGLGSVPDLSVPAYSPAFFGVSYTLAPNASMNFTGLFQTDVSLSANSAVYDSVAESLYDLYEDGSFTNTLLGSVTVSAEWRLIVVPRSADVPEPGMMALFAGLAIPCGAVMLRRRRAVR